MLVSVLGKIEREILRFFRILCERVFILMRRQRVKQIQQFAHPELRRAYLREHFRESQSAARSAVPGVGRRVSRSRWVEAGEARKRVQVVGHVRDALTAGARTS